MSGVCAFEVYRPPRTSIEINISQSLLIPHCFIFMLFDGLVWPYPVVSQLERYSTR